MEFTDAQLLDQPMGYWTGTAGAAIVGHLNGVLGEHGMAQRHWWALSRVAGAAEVFTTAELVAAIQRERPGLDVSEVAAAVDELLERGWLAARPDGTLTATEEGAAVNDLLRRASIPAALAEIRAGITDEEYVLTVRVLRRVIANLGSDIGFSGPGAPAPGTAASAQAPTDPSPPGTADPALPDA